MNSRVRRSAALILVYAIALQGFLLGLIVTPLSDLSAFAAVCTSGHPSVPGAPPPARDDGNCGACALACGGAAAGNPPPPLSGCLRRFEQRSEVPLPNVEPCRVAAKHAPNASRAPPAAV